MSSNHKRVFGQATRGSTRYQRQMGNRNNRYNNNSSSSSSNANTLTEEQERAQKRMEMKQKRRAEGEALDDRFGYSRYSYKNTGGDKCRRGWVFDMLPTTIAPTGTTQDPNDDTLSSAGPERAGLDLYFLSSDGSTFKSTILYDPYFYIIANPPSRHNHNNSNSNNINNANNISNADFDDNSVFFEMIISNLLKRYEPLGLKTATIVAKHDLDAVNHLGEVGSKGRKMLKLSFDTVDQLMAVRRELMPLIQQNVKRVKDDAHNINFATFGNASTGTSMQQHHAGNPHEDVLSSIIDIREYDVPYTVRVCIDLSLRAGAWYTITPNTTDIGVTLTHQDIETKADPSFLAFDIECTKAPLKFPDANVDEIFMISYMVQGQGYLILSRSVVSQDVEDFEYTPKKNYPGPFRIFNERNEEDLIRRFCSEFQRIRPQIVVTYNGDFFDWPFLEKRCHVHGLDIRYELGVENVGGNGNGSSMMEGEYRGRCCVHMDAFSWVKRDSYLPQGAQGLKAVTKYKLGYDPVEVDPEDMVQFAKDRPVHMASYSVSDAVATYYLYMKYVHMFIFSLCTIIPMGPEDVLRKGSGTLCEALLMVQACEKDIICPNKEKEPLAKFHQGHLLESETYIGGKVECLETGVYRSDIEYKFDLKPSAFQMLIDNIDRDLAFAIEVENGVERSEISNYDEIRCEIVEQLEALRDRPKRIEKPYVYHLDVGAMYPNIILTNRLQPNAMVDDSICAACDFNQSKNNCKRKMEWVWRGDYSPATKQEYERAKSQLSTEKFEGGMGFHELTEAEQAKKVATRLKQYAKNAYNRSKITEEITKKDTVCMRENDFYVNTVRDFRDKRYVLKKLTKVWGGKVKKAKDPASKKEAEDKALVYDSLQVAHKCILNSFYGYVMRKGARWRSMEMAGIVTKTGADLIVQARALVEQIGRPLELDTDGIWCILPQSFPDEFYFKTHSGSKLKLEYPCLMLNADVHANFTNHQYQTLKDPNRRSYETRSECSIFFEVDGPYRCMVLPASTEEGKLLKKRYAVFNFDGSLAELKGFELKRRGELELIKTFQSQVFERFLNGETLADCYDSVADIANHWLDVLDTQGESLEIEELVDLISENRNMSRQLEEYGDQKGTSQTTARRLGEFLGAEIIKDKGLNCKFIIAERPHGAPVTERAIPTAIWKAEPAVMKHHLKKWLKTPQMEDDDYDLRNILDWDYYRERLGKNIQKIITIPAALQKVPNPVPRLPHPEWLQRTVRRLNDRRQQKSITSMFGPALTDKRKTKDTAVRDIEDIAGGGKVTGRPVVHSRRRKKSDRGTTGKEDGAVLIPSESSKDQPRAPLTQDTFQEWLSRKKGIWNFRERRKRSRRDHQRSSPTLAAGKGTNTSAKKQRKTAGSMEGFIRDAAQSLETNDWHILEIRDPSSLDGGSSSGELIVWIMLGNGSLQRLNVTMPRKFYVSCKDEVGEISSPSFNVKRVEKHLPRNKTSAYLYEVNMPEYTYRRNRWLDHFRSDTEGNLIETFYELGTSQVFRSILHVGCVCRVANTAVSKNGKFSLSDLRFIDQPSGGKYMNKNLSFRKIFLYEKLFSRSKTGLIAAFIVDSSKPEDDTEDKKISVNCQCFIWAVKPGGSKAQRNISKKICQSLFSELMEQIHEQTADETDSNFATLSTASECQIESLSFVDTEDKAFKGVHDILNAYSQANNGPTLLLLNSTMTAQQIRKRTPSCNSYPLIVLPTPPSRGSSSTATPSLNWEKEAVQHSFEAYLFMSAVSFEKQIMFARYSKVPIGNLGTDAIVTTYDVMFARVIQKNRALLWFNLKPGCPDIGLNSIGLAPGSSVMSLANGYSDDLGSDDIWGDEQENMNPVVSYPGAYRSVCAEIDIHYLTIAALSDVTNAMGPAGKLGTDGRMANGSTPLGDEMSTVLSLPLLRFLVNTWYHDATELDIPAADQLLGHLYRLVSSPGSSFNDPALHRVVVSLMKASFNRLLGEFQRLGSTIISANFNRIVIATNKSNLPEAVEYVDFVIATIKKRMSSIEDSSADFSRLTFQRNNFYAHYLFLDEHNYGGLLFENRIAEDEDEDKWAFEVEVPTADGETESLSVVPTVQSGWNIVHYLGNETSQEYFRLVISRFSKDVYRKQIQLEEKALRDEEKEDDLQLHEKRKDVDTDAAKSVPRLSVREQLHNFKKNLVSKNFAGYLTQCVGEIIKDGGGPESFLQLPGSHLTLSSPVLEFIKNVITVLELDPDVDTEVQKLKKSLLAQIGVQEYSQDAKWENPCASFILPDVFCPECQECRDVDLCILPPLDEDQDSAWSCNDCGSLYDIESIERRLVDVIQRRCVQYQLQDLRCIKTNRVSTSILSRQSETSQKLKMDIEREKVKSQLLILHNLAKHYDLEWLLETTQNLLHAL